MISEHSPGPIFVCLKIHLKYFAGGRAPHDDMREALVRPRGEQFRPEYKRNVDAALIDSVEVHERVVPVRERRHATHQHLQHSGVLHSAHAKKVGSQPAAELPNDRGEQVKLATPKLGSPVHEIAANRPLQLVRPRGVAMIE